MTRPIDRAVALLAALGPDTASVQHSLLEAGISLEPLDRKALHAEGKHVVESCPLAIYLQSQGLNCGIGTISVWMRGDDAWINNGSLPDGALDFRHDFDHGTLRDRTVLLQAQIAFSQYAGFARGPWKIAERLRAAGRNSRRQAELSRMAHGGKFDRRSAFREFEKALAKRERIKGERAGDVFKEALA